MKKWAQFMCAVFTLVALNDSFGFSQSKIKQDRLNLVSNYIDLDREPIGSRNQMFSQLLPGRKSDVTKTHLALQLAFQPELNQEQKEVILDAINYSSPQNYLPSNRLAAQQNSLAIQRRVTSAFNRKLQT